MRTNNIEQKIAPPGEKKQVRDGTLFSKSGLEDSDAHFLGTRAPVCRLFSRAVARRDCGWGCGGWSNLDKRRRFRLGWPHGGLMLGARGSVKIYGNAARHDYQGVVEEVQIAGDAEDDGKRSDEDQERDPTTLQTKASAGEPERAHRIALNHRGMAVDAAHGESEEEGAAGLPSEVEPPTQP